MKTLRGKSLHGEAFSEDEAYNAQYKSILTKEGTVYV